MLSEIVLVMTFWGEGYNKGGPAAFTVEFHDQETCETVASVLRRQLEGAGYKDITSSCIVRNK